MRHVALILASVLLFGLGVGVVVVNIHGLTSGVLLFAGVSMAIAVALAVPADFRNALQALAPFVPWRRPDQGSALPPPAAPPSSPSSPTGAPPNAPRP